MYEQDSKELIGLIGKMSERIYDLTQKNESTFVPSNDDSADVDFLECERKAHQEANEAEIESLKESLALERKQNFELQDKIAEYEKQIEILNNYKGQHNELVTMIKDHQAEIAMLKAQLSDRKEPVITGSTNADHLNFRIKGLEIEVRRKEDECMMLKEELKNSEVRHQSEISRLAEQLSNPIQKIDTMAYSSETAKFKAETVNHEQTMMTMSTSLKKEIQERQRLHNELISAKKSWEVKLAEKEATIANLTGTLQSLEVILRCDRASIIPIVRNLFYESDAVRRSREEHLALERELNVALMQNHRLNRDLEAITQIKSMKSDETRRLESENARLREELACVKPPEGNEVCESVYATLSACSDITPMMQALCDLFVCLAKCDDYRDALDRVMTAATGPDPNCMMDIIVNTATTLMKTYLQKHSDKVAEINDKIDVLYAKLDRISTKTQDRVRSERRSSMASTSSRSSAGSRIPTLTRKPLVTKNQFGFGKAFDIPQRIFAYEPSRRNPV